MTHWQGPDEVHIQQIGQRELKRVPRLAGMRDAAKAREEALATKYGVKARL
jgi:acyl-CoA dehydrogenase